MTSGFEAKGTRDLNGANFCESLESPDSFTADVPAVGKTSSDIALGAMMRGNVCSVNIGLEKELMRSLSYWGALPVIYSLSLGNNTVVIADDALRSQS